MNLKTNLFDGKKINIIQLVNTIGDISEKLEKLESLEEKITHISEILDRINSAELPVPTSDMGASDPALQELDPDEWMKKAHSYVGLDEHEPDDEKKIISLSHKAGTPITDAEIPWCAIFVNAILAMCGLKTTGTMRARDFMEYGEECEEKVGAIVVYRSHVGFVSEKGKCLGGNQSDSVCEGEQSWYGKVLGYRWPVA